MVEVIQPVPPPPPVIRFGLSLDTLTFRDSVVPSGATMSTLLSGYGLNAGYVYKLSEVSAETFDIRRIRAGRPLYLAFDSTNRLRHLVYEPDALQWVRFDLDSVPRVHKEERKVDTVERTAGGTIEQSLWMNLTAQGHSPALVSRVADVLAWQIDFFTVQPGDQYRVLYDELRVDGKAFGLGRIKAVSFTQGKETSQAFFYQHGDIQGYYDEKGHPCKRMFLKAPLQYSRISSHFSNGRMHPVLRIRRPHHGVDYAAPSGTPVVSIGDGSVLTRGWDPKGGGNYVKIRHNATFSTTYMHLKGFASGLKAGQRVHQGDLIGYVGATGLATGPHLDFRFYKNGHAVNPLTVQLPPAPPLPAALLPEFLAKVGDVGLALESVAADFRPAPPAVDSTAAKG